MTVAEHLNRLLSPRIPFEEINDTQAARSIGPLRQYIVRIGYSWTWLVTKEGQVLAGELSWDATPEDAVRSSDAMLEAAQNTER